MAACIEIVDIVKRFGGAAALDGCSLQIATGSITGLIGPNGAGKTTLLNVICGIERADSGRVMFNGRDITAMAVHEIAAGGVVRSFQIVRELGSLTVLENLLLAPKGQRGETVFGALLRPGRVAADERQTAQQARKLLERVGLWGLADQPAATLSGGQKKLLELARALLLDPEIIFLDEPAAGVSPPMVEDMVRLIRELQADGITFGIVEHDMHMIERICDHVHVLAEGRTLASGSFAQVTRDRRVRDAYLGFAA